MIDFISFTPNPTLPSVDESFSLSSTMFTLPRLDLEEFFSFLSSYLSNNITQIIYIVDIVLLFILLAIYQKRKKGKSDFRNKATAMGNKVKPAMASLQELLSPTQFIEDLQIRDYQKQYQPLIAEIDELKGHKFFDQRSFNENGLAEFRQKYTNLKQEVEHSNNIYNALQNIKKTTPILLRQYKKLISDNHYFAHSESESLKVDYDKIAKDMQLVFPDYKKYVGTEEPEQLLTIIPKLELTRKTHNAQFVESQLRKNQNYFDMVLDSYPLDSQQRDSIVKLEDNCLVIASAGSGKTSTIVGKTKYLVEKRKIKPEKILLLTYTRKAANELAQRIKIDGLRTGTFHSLAYQIIAQVTGKAPSICEADVPLNVFLQLIQNNEKFLHAINNYIINLQSLMLLEHDYDDAFTYYEDRKKYGIQALFPDMDGRTIFTKSEEEKRICSMLTRLGISFRYEMDYPIDTRTPEHRQYKPDFTIFYKDAQENEHVLYLEHFAINSRGETPMWFGEGSRGGWAIANQKYKEGIEWKRRTHATNGTTLIETTSADFHDGTIAKKLTQQLTAHGVSINRRSDQELYSMLVHRNRKLEKTVYTLLLSFVTLMKSNEKTIQGLLETLDEESRNIIGSHLTGSREKRNFYILTEVVRPFFEAYQAELEKTYKIDFTDSIIQATDLCRKGLWKQYDYILVDEFQDISVDRYKLLQALRTKKPMTKLFCVGDDWQSIFRFAGSDMALFYDFDQYFGFTEQCKIETTYRFHQPLINLSSDFIMKNEAQKEKTIKPPLNDPQYTFLQFVQCGADEDATLNAVTTIVAALPLDETVLLLGRYNYDAMSVGFRGDINLKDNRIKVHIAGRDVFFLSVHSAKGLEADHVILINCNQGTYGFPSLIEDDPILDFVLSRSEQYPFAEERRLFYVAMTRARKKMYVLYDQRHPSPFIGEFQNKLQVGTYLCPKCLEGQVIPIKDGTTTHGIAYRSFGCSNYEAGCDFFETRFENLTSPGILITEETTVQDIERIRQERRTVHRIGFNQTPVHYPQGGGGRKFYPSNNRW